MPDRVGLLREQDRPPSRSEMRQQGKEPGLGSHLSFGPGLLHAVPGLVWLEIPPAAKEWSAQTFLSTFPDRGLKGKR